MIWFSIVDQMISLFIASVGLKLVLTRSIYALADSERPRHMNEPQPRHGAHVQWTTKHACRVEWKIIHYSSNYTKMVQFIMTWLMVQTVGGGEAWGMCPGVWPHHVALFGDCQLPAIMINVKLSNCNQNPWSKFNIWFTDQNIIANTNKYQKHDQFSNQIFDWVDIGYSMALLEVDYLSEDFLFIKLNKEYDGSFLKLPLYSMGYQDAS